MQRRGSAFFGSVIDTADGYVGRITDFLFDDSSWTLRWCVIDSVSLRADRRLLLRPACLARPDALSSNFTVNATTAQLGGSPLLQGDAPVALPMEQGLDGGFGYGQPWGVADRDDAAALLPRDSLLDRDGLIMRAATGDSDPHLRSLAEVKGYDIHALDGTIGHLVDFLVEEDGWRIDCALADTRNWWPGKQVMLPVASITEVNWSGRYLRVSQTRSEIRSRLPWTETEQLSPADG